MTMADAVENATETFLMKSAAARRGRMLTYGVKRAW